MTYRIGVIGGGQLARMMAEPAAALNIELVALVEAEDSSAAQVLPLSHIGSAQDPQHITELAEQVDVLTFEHEHVDNPTLHALRAKGISVQPGPDALTHAQNKITMRTKLEALEVPCPRWAQVHTAEDLAAFADEVGWPVVVKTPTGGYDGKGVAVVDNPEEVTWWGNCPLLVEEKVNFEREVAALVARRPNGELKSWPVVETIQENGVCAKVISPAPDVDPAQAAEIAEKIAVGLDVTGVLAVEMFATTDGRLLVNELAMRPHNSGHVTIDGHRTSQFEQHLRAVLDLPLGDTSQREPWVVMVNVLGSNLEDPTSVYPQLFEAYPNAKVHWYGKSVRPGRKLGHVTVAGSQLHVCIEEAEAAAALLEGN